MGGASSGGANDPGTGGADGSGGSTHTSEPRPQLTDEAATEHDVLTYLASKGSVLSPTQDNWDPTTGLPGIEAMVPDFTVADMGGTHATVQAAIDAALAGGGSERIYIGVEPGTYRELVCINTSTPPITLYGTGAGPEETIIVYDNYAGKAKTEEEIGNPCSSSMGSTTYGTSGSSTAVVTANGFQAKNLTFSNDTDESSASGGVQAVALMTRGDQVVLDTVRLLGNQDTFYAKGVNPALAVRVYVLDSYIEGDTDFIFGDARIVIDRSIIHVVGDRKSNGVIVAPSTHALNPYGILITQSTITAGEGMNVVALGRAWDEGQGDLDNYLESVESGDYPNGAAVVRDTALDAPIAAAAWASAATTGRPFSSVDTEAPKNRLYEYKNSGEGSAP